MNSLKKRTYDVLAAAYYLRGANPPTEGYIEVRHYIETQEERDYLLQILQDSEDALPLDMELFIAYLYDFEGTTQASLAVYAPKDSLEMHYEDRDPSTELLNAVRAWRTARNLPGGLE